MQTAILHAALFTPISKGRWGLPIAFEGEPGVAKSDIIEGYAAELGMPCETLCPGERGEAAFGVVPVPGHTPATIDRLTAELRSGDKKIADKAADAVMRLMPPTVLGYPRPEWSTKFDGDVPGVIFVDELTTAPPIVQPALLSLINRRTIGTHTFGARVRVIAAYNPPELAAGGYDLPAPVANRLGHLKWHAPTVEEHTAYMLRGETGNGGHIAQRMNCDEEEARVLAAWPDAWAAARGLETAFLMRRPELKNKCPKPGDPNASRAWPSDRTWEMAARALAGAQVHGLGEVDTEVFVSAFIGEGAASELFAFKAQQDLPDPAAVLDGRVAFTHNSARLDRTAALLNACTALVTPTGAAKRSDRNEALWTLMGQVAKAKADTDILVPVGQELVRAGLHTAKTATPVLAMIQPILRMAGVRSGR